MPSMRKKWRPSAYDKCYGHFLDMDMFGEQINFNIRGRTHYNTFCGVIFSLAIIFITVVTFYYSFTQGQREHEVPTLIKMVKEEYYEPGRDIYQVRQDSKEDPFSFAIAVTSY